MTDKITARFIIQIAGKPVENVNKALEIVKKRIEDDKKFKIQDIEIIEPEYEEETTLYSGLIETSARFDTVNDILEFVLDYAPNSVEVEDPEKMQLDAATLTGILNDFSSHILKTSHQIRALNAFIAQLQKRGAIPEDMLKQTQQPKKKATKKKK